MEFPSLKTWFEETDNYPFIIAGPCSVETEEQVLSIAKYLKQTGRVNIYRAGIWKPRTRPGTFNGVGIKGLKWLQRVQSEYKLRVAVEVASPKHIEVCLKHGIDVLWIGARTVSNPFSVEEISEALRGVDIPVLIKNPLNPDIDLWQGAIERISSAGIKKIAAVHRGFSPFERTLYRNMPKWEIPIELRQRIRNLPVICDPSHISGRADFVPAISQKALDLTMDGLMIEVHCNPPAALSDSAQQLNFKQFSSLVENLIMRQPTIDDKGFLNQLVELRNQVDSIDFQLIELIASRMKISEKMGEYKFKNNVAVLQMERWLEIIRSRTEHGVMLNMEPAYIERVMTLLHQESIRIQTAILDNLKTKPDHWSEEE
jgi:chorismate mutase